VKQYIAITFSKPLLKFSNMIKLINYSKYLLFSYFLLNKVVLLYTNWWHL